MAGATRVAKARAKRTAELTDTKRRTADKKYMPVIGTAQGALYIGQKVQRTEGSSFDQRTVETKGSMPPYLGSGWKNKKERIGGEKIKF